MSCTSVTVPVKTTSLGARPVHWPGVVLEQAQALASAGNAATKTIERKRPRNFTRLSYNFSAPREIEDQNCFAAPVAPGFCVFGAMQTFAKLTEPFQPVIC